MQKLHVLHLEKKKKWMQWWGKTAIGKLSHSLLHVWLFSCNDDYIAHTPAHHTHTVMTQRKKTEKGNKERFNLASKF